MFQNKNDVCTQTDFEDFCRICSQAIIENKNTDTVVDEKIFNYEAKEYNSNMWCGLQIVTPPPDQVKIDKSEDIQTVSDQDDHQQPIWMLNPFEDKAYPNSTSFSNKAKERIRIRAFANACSDDNIITLDDDENMTPDNDESKEEGEITEGDEDNENYVNKNVAREKDANENVAKDKDVENNKELKEKATKTVAEKKDNKSANKRQPITFKINETHSKRLRPSRFEPVNTLQQRIEELTRELKQKAEENKVRQSCQNNGHVETYGQIQGDIGDRNTKDDKAMKQIQTYDDAVMPIFGKPIKQEAKVEENIQTCQIDSDREPEPLFGRKIKKEAPISVTRSDSDCEPEPLFGRRMVKEEPISVKMKEKEERKKEKSHSKIRPQRPIRREREFSNSSERSKSMSCRNREELRKRWRVQSRNKQHRQERSVSRRYDRSTSRTRHRRDRSRNIISRQSNDRSWSTFDRNRDGRSNRKDRSRSRSKNKHYRSRSRADKRRGDTEASRNRTCRKRRSRSRSVSYEKTTIITFKQEITTSRSKKSSNRGKSIEWQEDRVVRELSRDSIKTEPLVQSDRVVREVSIHRYQQEQRRNHAANARQSDGWMQNGHDNFFMSTLPIDTTEDLMDDVSPVTALQELCKRKRWDPPQFSIIRMTEDSRPRYIYVVRVNGEEYEYRGKSFHSQHIAKEHCAKSCLVKLRFNHSMFF